MFILLAFELQPKWNKIIKEVKKNQIKQKFHDEDHWPLSKYNLNSGPIFSFHLDIQPR